MTDLEQAIHAIEHGLLPLTKGGEPPAEKIELSQRMQHYQVPGFSVAFVQNDEVAWASGFGVVQAAR